jgi:hypothetical protein
MLVDQTSHRDRFKIDHVRWGIDHGDRPSDETIRRVLRSAEELGIIDHYSNSPWYEVVEDAEVDA